MLRGFLLPLGSWFVPFLGLLGTGAGADAAPVVLPGTVRMAALLSRLAAECRPEDNIFLSDRRLEWLRTVGPAGTDPDAQAFWHYQIATELLQAGANGEARAEYRLVDDLIRTHGLKPGSNSLANLQLNVALTYLREAELRNCLTNHTAEACLFPIEPGGRHQWVEGSRAAMGVLTNFLNGNPDNRSARWLLNVSAMTVGDHPNGVPERWRIGSENFASEHDIGRFNEVAGPAGVGVRQLSGGSAADDFDGDGLIDVLVTSIGFSDPMHLFRNRGDGTFADVSEAAGLAGLTGGLNLVTADYDNDGDVDVFVVRGAWAKEGGRFPDSLLQNRGDGTFEDVTHAAGMVSFHPSQAAVWLDYDGDGWLDLFIGNETAERTAPHPCELYHNNRDGTFSNVAPSIGMALQAYVKGVTAGDYNNDGRPDLYLSIHGRPNKLFRNEGPAGNGWKFTEVAAAAGVALPTYSFPTWFFDFDNDGWEDLFVGGYRISGVTDVAADVLGQSSGGERARLYRNRGDGTFEDVSRAMGLDRVLHAMGANFGDLDNDGWLDFYLGTGAPDLLTLIPNRMFRNDRGKRFQDVTTSGGFGHLQKGHGVSFADFDNDGDQDVHEDLGGAYTGDIYPNALFANPGHGNHWVKVSLVGKGANRAGIGARLRLTLSTPSGLRVIHRTLNSGGSFGCNPLRLEIGLGDAERVDSLEIRWPGSGTVQTLKGLAVDSTYRVHEVKPEPEVIRLPFFSLPPPVRH